MGKGKAMQRGLWGFPHERLHQEGEKQYLMLLRISVYSPSSLIISVLKSLSYITEPFLNEQLHLLGIKIRLWVGLRHETQLLKDFVVFHAWFHPTY
jgi:hypothetical protein